MEEIKSKFILDVVPLTRIPLTRNQDFCYISEENLPSGSLVSIPLFRRNVEGIVVNSRSDFKRLGNIELKKINKVIEKEFLSQNQLDLAQFISEYYVSPLGIIIKNFVPKRTKQRTKKSATRDTERKNILLTKEQKTAVNKIINSKFKIKNSKFLLFGPSASGKTEVYIHSILELRKKDKDLQFLILVPEQTLTPQALERYGAHFKPEEIAILSSNISKGQYYSNWQKIKSGEAKIIIGTRMAIFAPFCKLGLVVIDEEQDISYKQWDMNPRYDARTCAEKLAEIHECPIVFGSATPLIESYYKAMHKKYDLIKLSDLQTQFENSKLQDSNTKQIPKSKNQNFKKIPTTEIVDMRLERLNKNISCISQKLKSEIAYALKNKLQTILFINRQGMSSFSVCDSCKTVLKCLRCDRALVYDNSGSYRCIHCTYKTSIIPECAKCQGIIFKNIGLGTQKVEREIKELFPGAKVARIDSQLIKNAKFQEKIYEDFSNGKIDILIGTQMISKGWDLPRVSLVGIIDADNALSIPDFSASAKFFQNIVQVSGRVNRPGAKFPGVVVLQTYQPENKIIRFATEKDFQKFYDLEIAERKALALPPFSKLIKLIFQDYSYKKTEVETSKIHDLLKKASKIKVAPPQNAFVSKVRGRYRQQITIKLKSEITPQLRKILNGLGQGWIADVEPISIT